ncbi:MAG TPA: extensin family protein [Pseudolabrys sp.]
MTGYWRYVIAALAMGTLLALGACGRSFVTSGERASWRHQAEVTCIQSGAVKPGAGVVQIEPIEGPGMCGADFPFKVAALGSSSAMSYGDDFRPPGSIGNSNPLSAPRYGASYQTQPVTTRPVSGETLRWTPGPAGVDRQGTQTPAGAPVSLSPPGMQQPTAPQSNAPQYMTPQADDIPDDAILPQGRSSAPRTQPAYIPPSSNRRAPSADDNDDDPASQRSAAPSYGPATAPSLGRGTRMAMASQPAALTPAATLACPLVSALDKWVAEGVQPAAQKWFGSQVATIKQISAYSCRGMVGAGISHVSEHAFGNALDVAGFVLADGRKILVQTGWHGSPEEQGFLHDVQMAACDTFTTVLAPGYNAEHYNHIHVDLMRRASGRRPCRPDAIPGEVAAAKARSMFAGRHGGRDTTGSIGGKGDTTGSISTKDRNALKAIAGEDGDFDDDEEVTTGSIGPMRTPSPLPAFVPSKATRSQVFRDVPP